jgi:hypothetical protein
MDITVEVITPFCLFGWFGALTDYILHASEILQATFPRQQRDQAEARVLSSF